MSEKIYNVSQTNFYEISKDTISQERLKVLLAAYKEVTDLFPNVHFGFSLFGSLSKGRDLTEPGVNPEEVDIDLHVYCDLTELHTFCENNPDSLSVALLKNRRFRKFETATDYYYALSSMLGGVVAKRLRAGQGARFNKSRLGSLGIQFLHPKKMMKDLHLANWSGYHQFAAMYFGYDIGMGLRHFTVGLLKEISLQADREEWWEKVKKVCIGWHRQGKVSDEIRNKIPNTFEDACRAYAVNI